MKGEFEKRNVKTIGLSADSLSDHKRWAGDIGETKRLFPKGYQVIKPYLRITPQPNH